MAIPVVTVASGGLPIVDMTSGKPSLGMAFTEAANGRGMAVTKVASGGMAGTYVLENGQVIPPSMMTWSPIALVNVTLSGGNLIATSTDASSTTIVSGARGQSSGKFYCEVAWGGGALNSAVGTLIGKSGVALGTLYTMAQAVGLQAGGIWWLDAVNKGSLGVPYVNGDTVCIAFDMDNLRCWFRNKSGNWNNSGTANPATNVGGLDVSAVFAGATAIPLAVPYGAIGTKATANFGTSAFAHPVPSGFAGWPA